MVWIYRIGKLLNSTIKRSLDENFALRYTDEVGKRCSVPSQKMHFHYLNPSEATLSPVSSALEL